MNNEPGVPTAPSVARLRVLSLGAGVQSTTLALMAAHGEIGPMPDCAIFADTQGEPEAVYRHLDWLEEQLPFPVHRVSRGSLWQSATRVRRTRDGERTYIATAIPVHMAEGLRLGMGLRHCTTDFKIEPIVRKLRALLGYKRITARQPLVELWIGISDDEALRKKPHEKAWIENRWPLLERGMTRADCYSWMTRHGYPEPPRSACTFCPFKDDGSWLELSPDELADAADKERELQAAYAEATQMRAVPWLHESRKPLGEVKFVARAPHMKRDQLTINPFINECEGMCGV